MGIVQEFKEFAVKGNVVDMAVGVIIGAAFGKIVSSLVADVVTPPIGLLVGGVDFSGLTLTIREAADGKEAVAVNYGLFLQATFDFLIVALAVFAVVKVINRLKRTVEFKKQALPQPEPEPVPDPDPEPDPGPEPEPKSAVPTPEEKLLAEIRDLLKAKV